MAAQRRDPPRSVPSELSQHLITAQSVGFITAVVVLLAAFWGQRVSSGERSKEPLLHRVQPLLQLLRHPLVLVSSNSALCRPAHQAHSNCRRPRAITMRAQRRDECVFQLPSPAVLGRQPPWQKEGLPHAQGSRAADTPVAHSRTRTAGSREEGARGCVRTSRLAAGKGWSGRHAYASCAQRL
jgi:hypothetical protein